MELETRTTSAPFYVGAALPDDDMIVKVFHCTNVNNVFDLKKSATNTHFWNNNFLLLQPLKWNSEQLHFTASTHQL